MGGAVGALAVCQRLSETGPGSVLPPFVGHSYRRRPGILGDLFLEGVASAAGDAEKNIIEVASLLASDRKRLLQSLKAGPTSYRLFEMLPVMPRFTIEHARQRLGTSFTHRYSCRECVGGSGHRGGNDWAEKEPQLQLPSLR